MFSPLLSASSAEVCQGQAREGDTCMEEFSLRVYRMLRSVSTAISRIGLGLAKRLDQNEGYNELQPVLASLCMWS